MQCYNNRDHSEGFECVSVQAFARLCAPLRLQSREMQPRGGGGGGCKDIRYCIVLHFQTYRRGDLGYEPTPQHMWSMC